MTLVEAHYRCDFCSFICLTGRNTDGWTEYYPTIDEMKLGAKREHYCSPRCFISKKDK